MQAIRPFVDYNDYENPIKYISETIFYENIQLDTDDPSYNMYVTET